MKMGDTSNTKNGSKSIRSEDEQRMEVAVVGPSRKVSQPKIFKLTIDCFDEIFEYLSLWDLHSVGKTCKTMQQVAGEYFKRNYSAANGNCYLSGITMPYSSQNDVVEYHMNVTGFNQFLSCITHYQERPNPLKYVKSHIDEFKSLNQIQLANLEMNEENIELIDKLLPKIEILHIENCWMHDSFYDTLLNFWVNLKRIHIRKTDTDNTGQYWPLQNYPMLEHLELIFEPHAPVIPEMNTFLERNPQLKRFSTDASFLWFNRDEFLKSNAKLDVLELKEANLYGDDLHGDVKSIWDLLKQLHKRGFYKHLFVYTNEINEELSNKLNSLPGLELLCLREFDECYNLPFLANLKELIIFEGLTVTDSQILANGLVNLERLYVDNTTIEVILPFICQSMKLKKTMCPKSIFCIEQ